MEEEPQPGPDLALLAAAGGRMADRGPRYQETPPDPTVPGAPFPAEPFNTVTASLFVFIALFWLIRLRGRYSRFPFLLLCMPILLVGGVGGTLYHAFRTRALYFFLDVIPISVLGLAGAVFLALAVWKRRGWWYLIFGMIGYLGFTALFWYLAMLPPLNRYRNMPVNVSYATLTMVILIPIVASLAHRRWAGAGLIAAALASIGIALFCRLIDGTEMSTLPMGTHWLWHIFGAITTVCTVEYFYRVERDAETE